MKSISLSCVMLSLCIGFCPVKTFAESTASEEPSALSQEQAAPDEPDEKPAKSWFLTMGAANVQARLKESETRIEKLIKQPLGALLPRWKDPVTFKDWGNDGKLWDLHLGIGRDLSPKWAWYIATGGISGTIKNKETYYPLVIPTDLHITFKRRVMFLYTGVDYYPWGKPDLGPRKEGENAFARRLKAARPYIEGATGYVNIRTEADVEAKIPVLGRLLCYPEVYHYDVFYLSPRLGVDIPMDEANTVSLVGGYLFFNDHGREFDNASFYMLYKHKF